jgi:oxygen-independent coproporphyrinogen III oxidase
MVYTGSKNGRELEHISGSAYGKHCGRSFSLTEKGAQHFNGVIALFFAPSVQSYLIQSDPSTSDDFKKNEMAALQIFARG